MKFKKTLSKILVLVMIIVLGMGSLMSFAENNSSVKYIKADPSKFNANGESTGIKYYMKHSNSIDKNIFQLYSVAPENNNSINGINYYCLNAIKGNENWINGRIDNSIAMYNAFYNLNKYEDYQNENTIQKGIKSLREDNEAVYKNIGNSKYLVEILWILDNIYIPKFNRNTEEELNDLNNKRNLLDKAGIKYVESEDNYYIYKYNTEDNTYDYTERLANSNLYSQSEAQTMKLRRENGWYYVNDNNEKVAIELTDELVEIAQQAAIWYYTNGINEEQTYNKEVFDIYNGLILGYKNSTNEENETSQSFNTTVEKVQQEQANILAWYLIDASKDYADSIKDKYWYVDKSNNTLTDEASTYWNDNKVRLEEKYGTANNSEIAIEHAKVELALSHISDEMENSPIKVKSNSAEYKKENGKSIIGPIKIEKQREVKYSLENGIIINNNEYSFDNNIYICDDSGLKLNKTLNEVIEKEFYITVNNNMENNPLNPGNNEISFKGNYLLNDKILWVNSSNLEQPIVEVTPQTLDLELSIKTQIPLEGKYNIVLVKEDQEGEQLNSKAEFKIKYPNNSEETKKVTGRLTIAENVEINQDNLNSSDIYIIEETKAPDRYSEFNGIIKLTIKKTEASDGKSYIIDEDNSSYIVEDKNGNQIENTDDVKVSFDGNNIVVEVKNYEKEFDLALQKYITKVISSDGSYQQDKRSEPQIDVSKLNTVDENEDKITTAQYTQAKNPISVINGDYVLYTLSVYNEGELDGYVNKITDNIPKGLQFVYLDNNKIYAIDSTGNPEELEVSETVKKLIKDNNSCWTIDKEGNTNKLDTYNSDNTISVTCDVATFSGENKNYLKAYDSSKNTNGGNEGLDRLSVTLLLRVKSSDPKGTIIRNEAAITEAEDKYHTKQDVDSLKDRDSKVTEWPGKDGEKKYQDDEDYDNVVLQDEPKIHKGVKEVYNQDSGYDAEEEQTWVIESDIPRNIEEYKKYNIIDDIDYRLKFSGIENVTVKIGTTTLVKDEDYTITYTENTNGVKNKTNSGTLKLVFINNNQMSNKLKDNNGKIINVTFKTTFAKDENGKLLAELGTEVPNQAKLEYTNSNGEEKEEKSEEPEVHTGGVTLYKYEKIEGSNTTNPIKDAEFTIYRTEADAKAKKNGVKTEKSGEDGIVKFVGLKYGGDAKDSEKNKTSVGIYEYDSSKQSTKYWIVETKVPEGYTGNGEPIEVVINKTSYKDKVAEIDYKIPNTPVIGKYSVILVKEDEDGVQLNSKAEFKVNNQTKEVVGKLTIVNNKEINKSNVEVIDVYTIEETKAPDRYSEFDGKITLQVSKKLADDGKSYVIKDKTFKILDKNGKPIENSKDATVTLEGNSIFVHVKNYEKDFDLKLMKFISEVNGKATDRKLTVDASKLNTIVNDKKVTTANYNVSKEPIEVRTGDYVTYTLRVYNEGEIDGYAKEIKENIPEGLKFVTEDDKNLTEKDKEAINFNKSMAWNVAEKNQDGTVKTVSTDYLSKAKGENNLITAYVGDGKEPKYKDVKIMLKVISNKNIVIRNEAAITEDEDKNGKEIDDRDSDTEKWKKENSEDLYEDNKNYPKYKEDDEDYDNIIVKNVDLALTKFIVAISNDTKIEDGEYLTADKKVGSKENPYLRATKVDTTELKEGTATTAKYIMVKDPLVVPAQSYVLYNIRVYNEGETDVYAGEIKDHLPEYLDYVDCEFNKNYGWKVGEGNKIITTDYLSSTKGKDNIIKSFDKVNDDGKGSGLSYKDVQILCRVSDKAKSNEHIKNVAEISKYEDKDGNKIEKDIDSTPNNGEKNEDDDDYEVVLIKTFDLSLIKFVSEVIVTEDGKTKTTATNNTGKNKTDIIPKVEVNKKKINSTVVKFKYKIKITNEGDIEGYAKKITDYVPQGLKFYNEDNTGWTDEGNNVISTKLLKDKLLKPGESAEVTVVLRWINGSTNLGLKRNNAEISEDYNDENVPDRDSTPDNKIPEEDDYDYADVMLSISTGISESITKYIVGSTIVITVLACGVISIKKFVL